eukprot:GHVU01134976.1.p1 GENE.GHVU01134976.1~~GHVU01134976.1.p1  ORF type:complete len:121 (+),score=0.03 GHVU01134976.1:134-496(+)
MKPSYSALCVSGTTINYMSVGEIACDLQYTVKRHPGGDDFNYVAKYVLKLSTCTARISKMKKLCIRWWYFYAYTVNPPAFRAIQKWAIFTEKYLYIFRLLSIFDNTCILWFAKTCLSNVS